MWHGCGGVRYAARAWLAAESKRYKADKIRRGVFRRSACAIRRSGASFTFSQHHNFSSDGGTEGTFAGAKTIQLSAYLLRRGATILNRPVSS